jgi:phosphatidylethanolamine/phosphatidyl-N-methylethanolamine N-methyltransferase
VIALQSPAERSRSPRWTDSFDFMREAFRSWNQVGAIAPSSRALARALTNPVEGSGDAPLSVLEVGAGSGAVTRALIPRLPNGSSLDIVEANPHFSQGLKDLVADLASSDVTASVHTVLVQDLETEKSYDVIVSGLPLTNFDPAQVEQIMNRSLELLMPGGSMTYFAYLGTSQARALTSSRAEARRHAAVDELMASYQDRFAVGQETVWANLPPARAWHLRRPDEDAR